MNDRDKVNTKPKTEGFYLHAQADGVTSTERRLVQKYNRMTFAVGLLLAIVVPPLIYRWKRQSMAVRFFYQVLEDGAKKDIERVYSQGRRVSEIPRKN